jgi:hypothetical protein
MTPRKGQVVVAAKQFVKSGERFLVTGRVVDIVYAPDTPTRILSYRIDTGITGYTTALPANIVEVRGGL